MTRVSDGATTFGKPYDFVGTKTFASVAGLRGTTRSTFVYDVNVPVAASPAACSSASATSRFAVNLGKVFDLVNLVPVDGTAFPGGIMQDQANDIIADKNITTLALELPAAA